MNEDERRYRRLYPRRKTFVPCRLAWQGQETAGTTSDVSFGGLSILLQNPIELTPEGEGLEIHIPDKKIMLRVRAVHQQPRPNDCLVGFEVELIESGGRQWEAFCYVPQW